jgi:hypothetical protein
VVKFRVAVILAVMLSVAFTAPGQESGHRYDALKQALGLSDAQVSQLQQIPPRKMVRPTPSGSQGLVAIYPADRQSAGNFGRGPMQLPPNQDSLRVLDDRQRANLVVIQKVWDRWDAVAFAIQFGLIEEKLWPGGSGTLCYSPIRSNSYVAELRLSDFQIELFEQLQQVAQGAHTKPRRDQALSVLDDAQRANLAAFETALQVANEAMELQLIPVPLHGEVLCH